MVSVVQCARRIAAESISPGKISMPQGSREATLKSVPGPAYVDKPGNAPARPLQGVRSVFADPNLQDSDPRTSLGLVGKRQRGPKPRGPGGPRARPGASAAPWAR